MEISSILNDVSDNDLEQKVIGIWKDSDIVIVSNDLEGCHRLLLGRNSTNENNWVIVKFVNRKHSELMLLLKENVSSNKAHNSLCPYHRFLWGKCKDLHKKGKVNQIFSLGTTLTVRVTENGPLWTFFINRT